MSADEDVATPSPANEDGVPEQQSDERRDTPPVRSESADGKKADDERPDNGDNEVGGAASAVGGGPDQRHGSPADEQANQAGGAGGAGDGKRVPAEEEAERIEYALPRETINAYLGTVAVDRMMTNGTSIIGDHARTTTYFVTNHFKGESARAKALATPVRDVVDRLETFAPISAVDELLELLDRRHVVCLTGPPQSGRFTTACAALADRHGTDNIHEIGIPPTADWYEALNCKDLPEPGCGHIIRLARQHQTDALRLLEETFRQAKASAVIISDAGQGTVDPHPAEVRQTPPDSVAVFGRHLAYRLRGRCPDDCVDCDGRCVGRYVADCVNHSEVREALGATYRLTEAIELALLFARDRPTGDEITALLRASQPRRRALATKILLPEDGEKPSPRYRARQYRRAFRISYALFHNQPLGYVFEATGLLLDEIDKLAGREPLGRPAFEHGVAELLGPDLAQDWAECRTGNRDTVPGASRTVCLRDPRLISAVVDVAWHDFDNNRPAMLAWLDRLVRDDREDFRRIAAAVAGLLAHHDFVQVHDRLIDKWSRDQSPRVRQSAAWAAVLAAYGGLVTGRVAAKVREWAGGGSSHQHDTAARVYATGFRQRFVDWTLEDLHIIAGDQQQRWQSVVADAVNDLYQPEIAGALVAILAGWAEGGARAGNTRVHAARAWLLLARRRARGGQVRVELVDRLAAGDVAPGDVAGLWWISLCEPVTSAKAWQELAEWVRYADVHDTALAVVTDVVGRLAASSPVRRRMAFYLYRHWRTHRPSDAFPRGLDTVLEGELT